MSCFGGRFSPDLFQNCCNGNDMCQFDGNLNNVVSEPIYVQKVYDAVLFHLQGIKTVSNQSFSPAIPRGHRLKRIVDIRCKKFFNPQNSGDPCNLKLNINTTISGGSFVQNANGEDIVVVGPDGTYSEKLIYADTSRCDERGLGTPLFGTQNVSVTGDVQVCLDLLLCDRFDHEVPFTVCTKVNIAQAANPMTLTNFFELCIPSTLDSAHLPRFTELCNPACETRLATNNMGRDLTICPDGTVKANLIIALCITCEKKILVPVQLCVLSTGFTQVSAINPVTCEEFPSLYPRQTQTQFAGSAEDGCNCEPCEPCDPCGHHNHCDDGCGHHDGCHDGCDPCDDPCDDFDDCVPYPPMPGPGPRPPRPPQPPRPQPRGRR